MCVAKLNLPQSICPVKKSINAKTQHVNLTALKKIEILTYA
jgi:hypothetical protein